MDSTDPMRHLTPLPPTTMTDACAAAPPQPEGHILARTVQIDVREAFDLHTGYAREGWHEFLWFSGWKAALAVFVLKRLR